MVQAVDQPENFNGLQNCFLVKRDSKRHHLLRVSVLPTLMIGYDDNGFTAPRSDLN